LTGRSTIEGRIVETRLQREAWMPGQLEEMAPEALVATVRQPRTGGARIRPRFTLSPFAPLAGLVALCLLFRLG